MSDGPYANLARRPQTCRIYGHYWHPYIVSNGEWKGLPEGVEWCGWCKAVVYPFHVAPDPSWWYCAKLAIGRWFA